MIKTTLAYLLLIPLALCMLVVAVLWLPRKLLNGASTQTVLAAHKLQRYQDTL